MRSALLLLGLLACDGEGAAGGTDETDGLHDSDDACEAWTWETAGAPVLLSWCTGCHGSGVNGPARSGAPAGVDFDTYDGASQWLDRIEARALADAPDMPPSATPPAGDLQALQTWIDCERDE